MLKTIALWLVFVGCCSAQPVFNPSEFGGNVAANVYSGNIVFPAAPSGANVTWDFSQVQLPPVSATLHSVPLSELPGGNWVAQPDLYAEKVQDANGSALPTYNVYRISPTEYKKIATGVTSLSTVNDVIVKIPNGYLMVDGLWTYDAYGTVITPFETFTNVIRMVYYQPPIMWSGWVYRSEYYATNPFRVILTRYASPTLSNATFYQYTPFELSSPEITRNEILVYPNPTTDVLNLTMGTAQNDMEIVMYNLLGQEVLRNPIAGHATIDIGMLPSGLYQLTISDGENHVIHQQKVIKK